MNALIKNYLGNAFRWRRGRQGAGYDKMLLATGWLPLPFDLYLLRFPTGTAIGPHTDKVESGEHYRLNIILKSARRGCEFQCADPLYVNTRITLFRPDRSEHSVTRIEEGRRYVLSRGWVRHSDGKATWPAA